MIDARKFARIRRRVMADHLHRQGFGPSNNEYMAKVNSQLRYVSFYRPKYGMGFVVTIALHFDFLPPFNFAGWPGAPVPAQMCSQRCAFNCVVRNRSGSQYHEYGETEPAVAEILGDVALRAAAGLDEIGSLCGDGERLLDLIPPQALADDLHVFKKILCAATIEEQNHFSNGMRIRQLLPGWYPHVTPTAILLGYLARRYGRCELIPAYVAVAKAARPERAHLPYIDELS